MAESAVSFLLTELSALLKEKGQLLGGLAREVESIQDELGQLRGFLRDSDAKETDSNLKVWITQLREISFDVEDVIDKYMIRFGRRRGTTGLVGCMKQLYVPIKDLIVRHRIAREVQDIKYRLGNVTKSRQNYGRDRDMYRHIDEGSSSKNEWDDDGRGEAVLLEDDEVFGIEEPKQQLLEWIESMDEGLDVIAVVGRGGLGKTTLVKKVFDDESVRRHFKKRVWVVASEFKDVKELLQSLIRKFFAESKEPLPQRVEDMYAHDMRTLINENLKETNYIVVVDDVGDVSRWETIRSLFPRRGSNHGCIIITTRFGDVADLACTHSGHVHHLKPLPPDKSKALFKNKAFPRDQECPHYLRKYAEMILSKCEGLPLAIVVIGGLLGTKNNRVEEWNKFSRSVVHDSEDSRTGRLWKLLSLSYYDLPCYLKYCFLALSFFCTIKVMDKEDIIASWIAEGFVEPKQHQTMEEVAEDYLNQLSNRNLIFRVQGYDMYGLVFSYSIHDLVREFITVKSREQNLITICDGRETEIEWPDKIRRLQVKSTINFSLQEINKLKYLRSLQLIADNLELELVEKLVKKCRLLKLLEIGWLEIIPSGVFKLYHLKALWLSSRRISVIPKEIKYLENLEQLEVVSCKVTELPDEILNLRKLRHIKIYTFKSRYSSRFDHTHSVKVPCNIGNHLTCLQSLCCIEADEAGDLKMVREIGKLTQLRRLDIAKLRSGDGKELCSSLVKLAYLKQLKIVSMEEEGEKMDLDYILPSSTALPFLSTLEVSGRIEKIPQWVSYLYALTNLYLVWSRLKEDPLHRLQHLPNLAYLVIHDADVEGLNFKGDGFQKLKVLTLGKFERLKCMTVEKGCMPTLTNMEIWDCEMLADLPQGIEHLKKIENVCLGNMPEEFVEKYFQDVTNEARFPYVHFGTVEEGGWMFY